MISNWFKTIWFLIGLKTIWFLIVWNWFLNAEDDEEERESGCFACLETNKDIVEDDAWPR